MRVRLCDCPISPLSYRKFSLHNPIYRVRIYSPTFGQGGNYVKSHFELARSLNVRSQSLAPKQLKLVKCSYWYSGATQRRVKSHGWYPKYPTVSCTPYNPSANGRIKPQNQNCISGGVLKEACSLLRAAKACKVHRVNKFGIEPSEIGLRRFLCYSTSLHNLEKNLLFY